MAGFCGCNGKVNGNGSVFAPPVAPSIALNGAQQAFVATSCQCKRDWLDWLIIVLVLVAVVNSSES